MANQCVVRLISSDDHEMSREELVSYIRTNGHDKYDVYRKQIFDEFYRKHKVDFFGEMIEHADLNKAIPKMASEFAIKSKNDRGVSVKPDLAIIYDASKCRMIPHVYDAKLESDCFQFIGNPLEALEEVREI